MNEKSKFKSVVSFRITEDEKKALDNLIQVLSTSKSEFLRKKVTATYCINKK